MKTLLVMRHAKSSWDDPSLVDAARPLNKRGTRDAPRMGRLLATQKPLASIVSSPAVRARATALLLAEAAGFEGAIRFEPRLYEASPATILAVVRGLPEGEDRVLLVGHNPGLEGFLAGYPGAPERLPTAALAELQLDLERWADADPRRGRVVGVVRPKDL